MSNRSLLLSLSLLLTFTACQSDPQKSEDEKTKPEATPRLEALLPDLNFPAERQSLDAKTGGSINFALGTVVRIPANSLVDKNGEAISGQVFIRCKQYVDALDFALAGIDMSYDSAGSAYSLQSDGMAEIRAFQNGQEIYLKEGAQMEIELAGSSLDPDYNLYRYDSLSQDWTILRTNLAVREILDSTIVTNSDSIGASELISWPKSEPFELAPPIRAKKEAIQIAVEVPEDREAPELRIFKNTQFELLESDTAYREEHMSIAWDWAEIKSTAQKAIYNLNFRSQNFEVSYQVRPVYEGQDYNEALATYEQEKRKFEQEKRREIAAAQQALAENRRIQSFNNRRDRIAQSIKNEQEQRDMSKQLEALEKRMTVDRMKTDLVRRSFTTNGFGTFNCDRLWEEPRVTVKPQYVIATGEALPNLTKVDVCVFSDNVKTTIPGNGFMILPKNGDFAAFAVHMDEFYFSPKKQLADYDFAANSQNLEIVMQKLEGEIPSNYDELRGLLKI